MHVKYIVSLSQFVPTPQGSPLFSIQQVKEHFKAVKQSVEMQPCLLGLLCTLHEIEICPILANFSADLK